MKHQKLHSVGAFAKAVGRVPATIRNWDATDYLKPHVVSKGGHRYYTDEQIAQVLGMDMQRDVVGYVCADTPRKADEQKARLVSYLAAHGVPFHILVDVSVDSNHDRPQWNTLLSKIMDDSVSKIVTVTKYELANKNDYPLVLRLLQHHHVEHEIIVQEGEQ